MAIKGLQSKQLANNPSTPAPKFNFRKYSTDTTFVNNSENIDFVTYDGSLYVCTSSTPIQPTHADPIENGGFLLVVAKGEDGKQGKQGKDGADGKIPQIGARFNGGQLEIFDSTGTRLTTSPDLTGKVGKPVQEGSTLSGELSKSNSVPSDIDLEQLRPVEEKPLLLRVDSDNTKRSDEESGPANMIQWKHEGDEHWTNLISISELMNIALAGVSFGVDEQTNKGHFGHKKVISATYDSHKDGEKIISDVELGEVLFDAGALPFMNYELDFNTLRQRISDLENALNSLGSIDLSNYVLKDRLATINNQRLDTGINFNLPTDFSGLTDIQVRVYNNVLQYKKAVNGTFEQQGTDVLDLSNIGEGDTSNGFVNARVDGINLILIRQDNTTLSIPLPSGGGPVDLSNYVTKSTFNTLQSRVDDMVENGFYIKLKIENSILYLSSNNSATGKEIGSVGGGGDTTINGNDLLFSSETVTDYQSGAITYKLKVKKGSSSNYEEIYSITLQDGVTTNTFNTQITAINDRIDSLAGGDFNVTTFRTFLVYTWYNGTGSPSLPESCSWDTTNNVLTLPVNTIGHESPGNVPSTGTGYKLWMSSATLKSDGTAINSTAGTTPVCLTADPGNPGKDGNGVEFIFTLIRDINDKQAVLIPVAPVGQGDDDIPNGWEDHPQGIGFYNVGIDDFTTVLSNLPNGETLFGIELASMRTYNGDTEQGGSYYPPFIGSKGGENGIDGDGIEYIYRLAGIDDVTLNNATGEITLNNTNNTVYPPLASDLVNPPAHYQHPDWIPGWTEGNDPNSDGLTGDGGYSDPGWDRNWTDEPLSVNRTTPYEFVSIRKYNGTTKTGGPFSTPVLWNRYVTDGETVYTSYIFTRTSIPNFTSAELSGGPEPENVVTRLNGNVLNDIVGSDTVPQGSAPVYMSYNLIGDTTDTGGSSPSPIGDTPFIQVEFSAEENAKTGYALPNLNTIENGVQIFIDDTQAHGINETLMRQRAGLKNGNVVGGDENDVTDPIGMATAVRNGGVGSGGTYAKIKGERGAKGEDGTSFAPIGTVNALLNEYEGCTETQSNGKTNIRAFNNNASIGTSILVTVFDENNIIDHTDMWVFTGENTSVDDCANGLIYGWRNAGPLQGAAGESSYIHQRFANKNEVDGTLCTVLGESERIRLSFTPITLPTFAHLGELPGKYVGMYVDFEEQDSDDITKYNGAKGSGDDGFGMEQIFILSETKPVRPILSNASGNNQATIYCNGLTIDGVSVAQSEITQKYYEYNAVPTIVDTTVTPNKVYTGNDRPQQPRKNVPCWVSVRKLNSVSLKEGSDPIEYDRYARDGQDGDFKEYVYHLYDIELTAQQLDPTNSQYVLNSSYGKVSGSNTVTNSSDQKDFLPGDSQGNNPTGFGTDNPVGVDETHQCEYVSTRDITYNSNNEPIFGEFSVPVLWSRFGQKGKDGDGLEYVFFPVSATIHNLIQANNNGKITVVNKTDSDFAENADIDPLTNQPKDYETEDEVCPKGRYTNGVGGTSYLSSVDDNPGITDTNPYVYASKRKYDGDTGKGEPFRDATLGTGMDPTLKKMCVLSVGNDNEPVGIDGENNHVRDGYKSINFDTGGLELRDLEGNLKRIDTLYLNNREFFNITNGVNGQVTKVNNASVSIDVDNGTLTITPYGGYVSDHLYYSCTLKLAFTPNNGNNFITFSNRVSLNLTAKNSDGYYGSATLTLTPETSKYIVEELSENITLIRKSDKDATDYKPSSLFSAVYVNKNTGLDTLKNVVVGVQFDDDPQHTIDVALGYYVNLVTGGDNTRFMYRPVNANGDGHGNALTYSSEGNDISFYFDENGNRLSNQNNAVLAVRFYNSCEHKDHDEYSCYFNVYLNNLNYVVTDNLRLRVGYNSEANYGSNNYENYITDDSYIAVVYPGKDGEPGDPGFAVFKSIVFKRSATQPTQPGNDTTKKRYYRMSGNNKIYYDPTQNIPAGALSENNPDYGGTFNDPVPYGGSNEVPNTISITNPDDLSNTLGMTTRVFTDDGLAPQEDNWTTPRRVSDTESWDFEFAYKQTDDAIPPLPTTANRHGGSGTQIWFDPEQDVNENYDEMYGEARCMKINGEGVGDWTILRIKGEKGDPGKIVVTYQYLNGKVIRMSNGTDNQLEYSNGETAIDGVCYLDVVKYVSGSTTSYYKCISDVTYTSSNKPANPSTDSTHWEVFTPQSDAGFETMLANSAYIENLTSKQVVITDNNSIVAGMASGADIATASNNQTVGNVRIGAGTPTTSGDLTTAPFTVNANGSVRASDIDLAGGHVSGSFTIGANGSFSTRSTGSGNTTQTVITSGSITNTSYTGSTISSEAKLGDGKVVVADNISDFNVYSELESQHLTFYNRSNGSNSSWQSVTTPYIVNGVYGNQSSDWGPIFKIQSISQSAYNALTSPDSETLYVII